MSDGMTILERTIEQAAARHRVITSNIANVDTPNYKIKDVSFGRLLGNEMALASTDPKHIQATESNAAGDTKIEDSQPWLDKNNVEMDLEVAKMTENAMLYETGVTLFMKKVQMFKEALKTK
jgi:flagellar basal-body rod protein FlgB